MKNKITKKKIYLVNLPDDVGELWLDENKKPLDWIASNDANFRTDYQSFIIEYLGGELIELSPDLPEDVVEALYSEADCVETVYNLVKKYL